MIDRSGLSPSLVASSTPVADVALSSELKKVKGRAWVYFFFSATADLNKHICQFPHCHRTYIAQTTSTLIERRHSTAHSTHLRLPCVRGLKPGARFAVSLMKEGNERRRQGRHACHEAAVLDLSSTPKPFTTTDSQRFRELLTAVFVSAAFAALALFRRPWTTSSSRSSLQLEFISVSVDESFPLAGVPGL